MWGGGGSVDSVVAAVKRALPEYSSILVEGFCDLV